MRAKTKRVTATIGTIAVAAAVFATASGLGGTTAAQAEAKTNSKVAIVYFSGTGTTKSVATKIQKNTKGKLVRIQASDPYTSADLDYSNDNSRVVREHESASSPAKSTVRPKIKNLKTIKSTVKKAKTVYIGYPIWWAEAPHIMYTLVENVSLKGKNVVPFTTSMSSGSGSSATHLKSRAIVNSKTKWAKAKSFYGRSSQTTVDKWIAGIKF